MFVGRSDKMLNLVLCLLKKLVMKNLFQMIWYSMLMMFVRIKLMVLRGNIFMKMKVVLVNVMENFFIQKDCM